MFALVLASQLVAAACVGLAFGLLTRDIYTGLYAGVCTLIVLTAIGIMVAATVGKAVRAMRRDWTGPL